MVEQEADAAHRVLHIGCLTKKLFPFTSLFNLLLSNGRSRTFSKPIKFLGRDYLSFINGGTVLNNRSLPTCMTGGIESCGTGDVKVPV